MLLVLAVIAITVPALAGVTMSGAQVGTELKGQVSYDASAMADLVRAFGLNISCSDGALITAVTLTNADYDIYPGSIQINAATGLVEDSGSPVAVAVDYPGTDCLGGVGTTGMTIEMGWLDFVPENNDVLVEFTVDKACTVTVAENAPRGGIVMEDPTVASASTLPLTFDITAAAAVCKGDLDGNEWINTDDIGALVTFLTPHAAAYYWVAVVPENAQYDLNGDDWINTDDIGWLVTFLTPYAGDYYWVPCP